MRCYLTFIAFFLSVAVSLQAQTVIEPGSKPPVKGDSILIYDLLKEVEDQFQVEFAFESGLNEKKQWISKTSVASLDQFLSHLANEADLEYEIREDIILLRPQLHRELTNYSTLRVIDKRSRMALPYSLMKDDEGKYWYTDSLGHFDLAQTDLDTDSLRVRYIGYSERAFSLAELKDSQVLELNPLAQKIPVIYISSPLFPIEMMKSQFIQNFQTLQTPSSLISGDVLRNVQLQSGISSHKDNSALIEIRGSEAFETMVNLDGIVIYNPTHFYNLFSAVNGVFVQNTSLYKNNLPIEYAGRTGGLVAIKSRNITSPEWRINGWADLLNAAVSLEFPLSKKSGLLIAGRTSYSDLGKSSLFESISGQGSNVDSTLTNGPILTQLNPSFKFYDINAKFQSRITATSSLDLNFYHSQDDFSNTFTSSSSPKNHISSFLFDYKDLASWQNLGFSGNLNYSQHKNHQGKISAQYSQASSSNDFNFTNQIENRGFNKNFDSENQLDNRISDLHVTWTNKFTLQNEAKYTVGIEGGFYQSAANISSDSFSILGQASNESVFSLFQDFSKDYKKCAYQLGLRAAYLSNNNRLIFDPRLAITYKPEHLKGKLYTAFSINHQYLTQFSYENRLGVDYAFWIVADEQFPVLRSYQSMLGYRYATEKNSIRAEIYYKMRDGLTEYALIRPGVKPGEKPRPESFQFFYGKGRIWGIDLELSKKLGAFQSTVNYTLSRNLVSYEEIFGGRYFPDNDHRTHQLKWLNNFQLGDLSFNGNLIFSSGKPYLDVSTLDNDKSRKDLKEAELLSYLPPYLRLDAGLNYVPSKFNKKLSFGLSVFNLLNRKNVYSIQYIKPFISNPQNQEEYLPVGAESNLLERTVNLQILFDF